MKKWLTAGAIAVLLAGIAGIALFPQQARMAATIVLDQGPAALVQRALIRPSVAYRMCAPEEAGFDSIKLNALDGALAQQRTGAFLIVRDGCLIHESYPGGQNANTRASLAATAKGVFGTIVALVAANDGHIAIEDPVSKYVPSWADHPQKSKVTLLQTASHRSGIEDLWGGDYQEQRDRRFHVALNETNFLFEPGAEQLYSGTAYYVLAYVLATALRDAPQADIRLLLEERVLQPLGVPSEAWHISYGESYENEGLTLYAIGSGARATARTLTRIGELLVERGEWNDKALLSAETMQILFDTSDSPRVPMRTSEPPTNLGWWINADGYFASLPRDAMLTLGKGSKVVLIVPSLQIVVVRLGNGLGPENRSKWANLEDQLFRPLMMALTDRT